MVTPSDSGLVPAIWLLTDGAAGNFKQAQALAERLQPLLGSSAIGRLDGRLDIERLDLQWQGLDRWLAPFWKKARFSILDQQTRWPQIAIGCGRMGAAALLAVKRQWPKCKTVQILDPRVSLKNFDVVIAPRHDQLSGTNVIQSFGGLHQLSADLLAAARSSAYANDALAPAMANSASDGSLTNLLLLGAPNSHARYSLRDVKKLLAELALGPDHLRISVSRRTPQAIKSELKNQQLAFYDPTTSTEPNPYLTWLAQAQQIIVTPDSVNMITEAMATTAAVHVPWQHLVRGKFKHFFAHIAPRLSELDDQRSNQVAWNDMDAVAQLVRRLISLDQ